MKKVYNNFQLLPIKSKDFLKRLDLDIIGVKRLTADGKLLFLIKTVKLKYVLKVNLPPRNFVGKLRAKFIDSVGFQKECSFYRDTKIFKYNGNFAEYFDSDKYNLLIGLLPENNFSIKDLREKDWKLVSNTLGLFNWGTRFPDMTLKSYLHRFIYGVQGVAFHVGIPTVSKILGIKTSIRYVYEIVRCIMTQPKLTKKCLSHNDFLPNNFIFSEDFNKLYIIDFQDITSESRWPLYDLIRLLSYLGDSIEFKLKREIINSYLQNFPSEIIDRINIEIQVRFCVLQVLIHSLQWRKKNGNNYSDDGSYLKSILFSGELNKFHNELILIIKEYFYEC